MALQSRVKICSTYGTKVEPGKKKVFLGLGGMFHSASPEAAGATFPGNAGGSPRIYAGERAL